MVIYMQHPVHGTKVAVAEDEAKYDESNGWKRFEPIQYGTPVVRTEDKVIKPVVKENPEREALTKQYVDKFGRKPHWKMSVEKIKESLCQPA